MTQSHLSSAFKRPVALVGLMGVGKTTIGRRLAKRLSRPFVDADEAVEESAGRSVADIFADFGEAAFRDGERRVIARLLDDDQPIVLALGGGAFVNEQTRALVKDKAVSIWLKADLEILMERVSRKPGVRPLLNADDPRAVMEKLNAERAPIYAQADLVVESDESSHDATAARAYDALAAHVNADAK